MGSQRAATKAALVLGTMIAAGAAGAAERQAPRSGVHAARRAPRLELPAEDGSRVRLADRLGRVVVVDFWASWCGPCQQSFPELDALFAELHPRGLDVLAVSVDEERAEADAFLAGRPHRLTVLFDPKATSASAFGVEGMPTTFVVDRRGLVRARHEGYSTATRRALREDVLRLLAEPAAER